MIPAEWDDGFTHEGEQGILYRPILREQRKQLRDAGAEDLEGFLPQLFSPPYYWGPHFTRLTSSSRLWFTRKIISSAAEEDSCFREVDETVTMLFQHAGLVLLSCDDCKSFATNHETGEVLHQQDGSPITRRLPPPCDNTIGCPRGHWTDPKGNSEIGKKVWRHFWRYRSLESRCPIILRNRSLINWIVLYGRRAEFNPFPR